MANMSLSKVEMPEQKPTVRARNFDEVALGYSKEMALEEAARCLLCKNPRCVSGCPVNVSIPAFIRALSQGEMEGAYEIIRETNSLPAVCGRVCPQESQCEQLCVRGKKGEPVAIGRLERFVADWHMAQEPAAPRSAPPGKGRRVAVIGAGPAGLSCAGDLAQRGYQVTVFEAFHAAGGVLIYGIPEFRLPAEILAREVEGLKALGVTLKTNMVIGRTMSIDALFEEGFEAVFIGTGAGLPSFMHIEGENLLGVYSANEFLTRVNLMRAHDEAFATPIKHHKKVAVVGGGNVAMDAARCAMRLGAEEVHIVYRRSMKEMPARVEEVFHAREEGIALNVLVVPTRILGDENKHVRAISCIRMELGEPDESGRRSPRPVEGSEFELEVDALIMAIGTTPNPLLGRTTAGLALNDWGCIVADPETMATTRAGVYAGGDAVTGAATVILAMGAGKTAARSIDAYLQSKQTGADT